MDFFSAAASVAGSAMLLRTVVYDLLPGELVDYFHWALYRLFNFSSELTVVIQELEGCTTNEIYKAARTYLGGRISPTTRRVRASKPADAKNITVTMAPGEEIVDVFEGVKFRWELVCKKVTMRQPPYHYHNWEDRPPAEIRSFQLSFHRKHKERALGSYLPHVLSRYRAIKEEDKTIKLHMLTYADEWEAVDLDHPATFDTLAMEPALKQMLMEDLQKFVEGRDYYRRVGKAWKRGYLLYGPPGTGKSSLIAAMANFLRFDVYDLELTAVNCNTTLRSLLVQTANRSILVVEDVDCTIEVINKNREAVDDEGGKTEKKEKEDKVTLSGLLNFIDGLWSSCGEQRIIVFTTNHRERLDPALLRPGRMDMHIHMTYCSQAGFRTLASNYHGVDEHPLFGQIEELMQEVEVTAAEVAGELMKSGHAETALQGLIGFLRGKKERKEEEKKKEEEKAADLTAQASPDG